MSAILTVSNVNKKFGGVHAVNDVSFSIEKNTVKSIIGPNGAGKSSLFNLISGHINADSGKIIYNGKQIQKLKPYKIAKLGISRTFQIIKLFPKMSVIENVMIGRHLKSRAGFVSAMFNAPWTWLEEKKIRKKSEEIIDMLGLIDIKNFEAVSLPFGKQRLVELGRALAAEPRMLLLDEPASGLNNTETDAFGELILKIKSSGITVLLVEHDMSLVMNISDHITVLNYGKKIAEGTPAEIRKNPEVIKVYLGDEDDA